MPETPSIAAEPLSDALPEPAAPLQAGNAKIHATRMRGLPFVNEALEVEAIGFRRWSGRWLGVLVTPWFLSVVLMPDLPEGTPRDQEVPTGKDWYHTRLGSSASYELPAGSLGFIGAFEPGIGEFQTCSLFSPVFEFADHATARATAQAALTALFDPATRETPEAVPEIPRAPSLPDDGSEATSGAAAPAASEAVPMAVSAAVPAFGPAAIPAAIPEAAKAAPAAAPAAAGSGRGARVDPAASAADQVDASRRSFLGGGRRDTDRSQGANKTP